MHTAWEGVVTYWFYSLLKLLTTVSLFASSTVLQTWHHTNHDNITDHQGSPVNLQYLRSTLMKQIALDSSLNELSIDLLTVKISCAELPLALFW